MLQPQHSRVPTDGSLTLVQHDSQSRSMSPANVSVSASGSDVETVHGVLHLRGGPRNRQHVAWTEDVIDNEKLGKKKSKICCIYHKPRRFDESSSSSSSSSDSEPDERPNKPKPDRHPKPDACSGPDSDSGFPREGAQPSGRLRSRAHRHRRHHPYPHPHPHTHPGPCEHKAEDRTENGEPSFANLSEIPGPNRVHPEHTPTQAQQFGGIYGSDSDSVNDYERQPKYKGKGKAKDMDKAKSTRVK